MSETISGRNVKIEVALTFDAAILPTAVTKAYPPVATLAAHGLANGECGFWSVPLGMIQLDQQAIMVANQATNSFEMPGLDSADYDDFDDGPTVSLTMAATWGTLAEAVGYTIGGGAATQLDDMVLMDGKQRNITGALASQDVTIQIRNKMVDGAVLQFLTRNAMRQLPVLFKITKRGKVLRVFYGTPSLPGESLTVNQLASGDISVTVPQWAVKPNVA